MSRKSKKIAYSVERIAYRKKLNAIRYPLFAKISAVIIAVSLFFVCQAHAKEMEMKQKSPIVVNGDKVEYFHEQKKVIGVGNISIDYEDVKLTCKKVTVYLDTREAIAEGDVKVTQKDTYLTGERMNYNFDTRKGRIIDAYVNYVPFYGKSKDVEKAGENNINIVKGMITTCDQEQPHYRIEARRVEIYIDDKVMARDVVTYIGNCPVMWLPYYYQPIKDESTHIVVQPGHDRDWGYYVLNSMKFRYSDIFQGRFRVDYRTKNGLAFGVDNSYSLEAFGLGYGIANFYYADEDNDYFSYKPTGRNEGKYRLQIRHLWQVTDDTLMTMELEKVRDDNMTKYYFYNEWREHPTPDNYISFVTSKPDYNTTFLVRTRLDKYYDVVQRLPEFNLNIPNYNIKYFGKTSPLYYNANFTPVYLQRTFPDNSSVGPMQKDQDVIRMDLYNKLSYVTKPIPYLTSLYVTPYAGTRQTFYSRNKYGDTNLMRGIFDAGADASMKLYKIYDVSTNFLGLDINKLRHVITPTANYYYTHQPTIDPANLMQFDAIDALQYQNGIKLQIESKFQTKRGGSSVDLVDFIINTDYQFRVKKDEFALCNKTEHEGNKFKTVFMQLELTPYPWLYTLAKMNINTKYGLPGDVSVDFVGGKEEDRSIAFGYRYQRSFVDGLYVDPDDNSSILNYVTADGIYRFNEKWKARVYWRYNMNKGYIDEHQYTISRDLHCWILEFTYDFRPYEDNKTIATQTFWVSLRLKAFPRMPLGVGRSYSRTRAGQPGDVGFIERQSVAAGKHTGFNQ